MHLAHLEKEGTVRDKDVGNDVPNGIDGVTEEFMVHLARAVKDAQTRRSTAITVVAQKILSITVCS